MQFGDTNIQFSVYYLNAHQHAEINYLFVGLCHVLTVALLKHRECSLVLEVRRGVSHQVQNTGCARFGSGWTKGLVCCCSRAWLKKQCRGDTFCTNGEISNGHQKAVGHDGNEKNLKKTCLQFLLVMEMECKELLQKFVWKTSVPRRVVCVLYCNYLGFSSY